MHLNVFVNVILLLLFLRGDIFLSIALKGGKKPKLLLSGLLFLPFLQVTSRWYQTILHFCCMTVCACWILRLFLPNYHPAIQSTNLHTQAFHGDKGLTDSTLFYFSDLNLFWFCFQGVIYLFIFCIYPEVSLYNTDTALYTVTHCYSKCTMGKHYS